MAAINGTPTLKHHLRVLQASSCRSAISILRTSGTGYSCSSSLAMAGQSKLTSSYGSFLERAATSSGGRSGSRSRLMRDAATAARWADRPKIRLLAGDVTCCKEEVVQELGHDDVAQSIPPPLLLQSAVCSKRALLLAATSAAASVVGSQLALGSLLAASASTSAAHVADVSLSSSTVAAAPAAPAAPTAAAVAAAEVPRPIPPAVIQIFRQPRGAFDPTDVRLQDAVEIFRDALAAKTVEEEERLWSEIIDRFSTLEADWVADISSRAFGNRGNARSRQGKLLPALEDYNKSISLAPYAIDPVLNRGVLLETLGLFDEAVDDYKAVLEVSPLDPAAWNNLGNVMAAMGRWDEAAEDYQKASRLSPEFSFAAANYALALYQIGRDNDAIRQFRTLLRKYPEFPDMRAALAVSLYAAGLTGDAETNWTRVEDGRYRDRQWVQEYRKWPPRLVTELAAFLDVK